MELNPANELSRGPHRHRRLPSEAAEWVCQRHRPDREHPARRLGVPSERITRFAAPRARASASTRLPSLSPTLDGIRDCLNRLAEEVGKGDLVFLYYWGHGSQAMTRVNGEIIAGGPGPSRLPK